MVELCISSPLVDSATQPVAYDLILLLLHDVRTIVLHVHAAANVLLAVERTQTATGAKLFH